MFKALFGSKNTVLDLMQSSFCIYYMLLLATLVLFVSNWCVTTGCRVRSGRLTRTSKGIDERLCSESGARLDSQAGDKMY